jgi:hypothetical protein
MSSKYSVRRKKQELLDTINEVNYILEPIYKINFNKIENLKILINKLENEIYNTYEYDLSISNNDSLKNKNIDIVGTLPKLLYSKEIFNTNEELIKFSNNILNTEIDIKSKKPRQYLVGAILYNFLEKNYDEQATIMNKINIYIQNKAKSRLNNKEFFKEWDKIIGAKTIE